MSERTATLAMEALEKDRWEVQRSVMEIMHILHDYIPRAVQREVEYKLFDAFFINGVELTTNLMRKEYEAWKVLQIDSILTWPRPSVQP